MLFSGPACTVRPSYLAFEILITHPKLFWSPAGEHEIWVAFLLCSIAFASSHLLPRTGPGPVLWCRWRGSFLSWPPLLSTSPPGASFCRILSLVRHPGWPALPHCQASCCLSGAAGAVGGGGRDSAFPEFRSSTCKIIKSFPD